MASELLRYSLFDENVSENIFGSKAAADENKHGSSKIWRSDKGGDVFDIKRDHACLPVDETVSCNYDCWSNGHAEVVEGNWVLHDRGFISHVPKEKWKNEENLKGDHLDVEGLRQRGLFREEQDRETDLKSTFAAVSNWIEDLHLETGEFEAAARIEMENKQVDPKYWLGGHWDMGQPFAGSTCTSGGKPGNIIRENNLLLAEWGTHNPFWQKLEGDQVECQAISQHEDFKPNVSPSQFREKANQKYEEALSSPWTTVDITVGFHVPDSRYLSTVQGEDIDTWQGNNTNKRSVKIGDLGHEMDGTYKRFLSPSKEEMVGMLKQSTGGNMHEPAVEMGTLFEEISSLCLPGCTRISAEGIVKMVKGYRERKGDGMPGLKHLRIRGLYGITKEHLDNLKSYLDDGLQQRCESVKPQFYHNGHYSFSYDDDRSIDIEVCPKCGNARLVYDCTRERCQQKKDHKLQQCRGCIFCIARCEECGRCIDDNEYEETFCLDLLCSACWLQLPKCLECNRPGCGRHADHFIRRPDTSFVCGDCRGMSSSSLGPEFHVFA